MRILIKFNLKTSVLSIVVVLLTAFNSISQEDSINTKLRYGVSVATSLCGYSSYDFPSTIMFNLTKNKHQFEIGPKFGYGKEYNQEIGVEFNYRFFPNGINNRFNPFFLFNTDYFNKRLNRTYVQVPDATVDQKVTHHYYTLNIGYGLKVKLTRGLFIYSNIGAGLLINDYKDVRKSNYAEFNSKKGYVENRFGFIASLGLGYTFNNSKK